MTSVTDNMDGSNNDGASVQDGTRLVRDLVGQLTHGCGNSRCTQVLCQTGRANTSSKPVRKYSQRAALGIALSVCSGPRPRSRLCHFFVPDTATSTAVHDAPGDPSSLMQLLCDTPSVRRLQHVLEPLPMTGELLELKDMHARMDSIFHAAGEIPSLSGNGCLSNAQLADRLYPQLQWLLLKVPLNRLAPWTLINREYISNGLAYPQKLDNIPTDQHYNTWLRILDALAHEPYLRLLSKVLQLIGRRLKLEKTLDAMDYHQKHHFSSPRRSISAILARRFYSDNAKDPTVSFAVLVWLKKLFASHWNGQPIIHSGSVCHAALAMMASLQLCQDSQKLALPQDVFKFPMVASTVGMVDMSQAYLDHLQGSDPLEEHILHWNILFSKEQLTRYLRTMSHLVMRKAHSEVEKVVGLHRRSRGPNMEDEGPDQIKHAEQHYLLLNVSRSNVLKDTFDQLWRRRKEELRRPLRVRLGETDELEIGHDLGGVQIEFFNLVCRDIFAEEAQMFVTDPTTGYSFFRPGSLQPLYMFELFGLLIALAIHNGITIPINLPAVFYELLFKLSDKPPMASDLDLSLIEDGWPVISRSLKTLLSDDVSVSGLDFTFPFEANGLRLAVSWQQQNEQQDQTRRKLAVADATPLVDLGSLRDAWPGWTIVPAEGEEAVEVTADNRSEYVQEYIHHLCYGSVAPQWDAFYKGFHSSGVVDHVLTFLPRGLLQTTVEGTSHLDMNELRATTRYDGYCPTSKYIQWFWRIVTSWPESKQKQLLKFVTAAERIPISGASNLTFIIKKSSPDSMESLPTSSTCFGTLMLPRYATADILSKKLSLALKYGTEGFGTG